MQISKSNKNALDMLLASAYSELNNVGLGFDREKYSFIFYSPTSSW